MDKLCDYFATIGASLSENIAPRNNFSFKIHSKCCLNSFVFHNITKHDVSACINNIKINSAQGIDEIPSKFVKMSNGILSPVLAKLFNKCIKLETFPDSFKIAYAVPVAKVPSPKSLGDFRLISLLSVFSKAFEKIVETNMTKFVNKNSILTSSQFGFRETAPLILLLHHFMTNY